jgi:glycerol-3-phosphate acyltransferase PlsY
LLETTIILLSYIVGSIPIGYLLTKKATGKNIFELGSGNPGSTNVRRVAGKKISILTQLGDILKGLLPVAIVLLMIQLYGVILADYFIYIVAISTITGHNFSVFLRLRGGKGVNTTLGASVLLAPISVFVSVAVYFLVKWKFKYVSLGSIILGVSLPLTEYLVYGVTDTLYYLLVCAVLILFRHTNNIIRLLSGNEML